MAQLLLIKDANTADKEIDDIVGFFKDTYTFSDIEHIQYKIMQVKGYDQD